MATVDVYRRMVAARMPEDELEENVRKACDQLGLLRYHTLRPKGSPAGFPDDVIVGPGGFLVRELKREGGTVSARQRRWLEAFTDAGVDAGVWRPSDWLSQRVMNELVAVSRPLRSLS